jgi:molecular chaperone GrpE
MTNLETERPRKEAVPVDQSKEFLAEELVNEQGEWSGEAAADSDTGSFEDVDSQLVQLEAELAAANDRAIRAHAELENFRKRVYREMEEERKYASLPLLRGSVAGHGQSAAGDGFRRTEP